MAASSMDTPSKAANPTPRSYTIETKNLYYHPLPPALSLRKPPTGRAVLADVTCEARPGELTAIAGPSGAGKTTLLSLMACLPRRPGRVHGRVLVNGRDPDAARFRRVSGYVSQDDALLPQLTVRETLLYSARLRLRPDRDGPPAIRAGELLEELGLGDVAGERVGRLAGGERRRVSIGVELVHGPAVLLLDEPTSGLDSASALHVVRLLKSMATLQGKTVVLTIHQPSCSILDLFSRLILLSNGAVRHNGSLPRLHCRLEAAGHCLNDNSNILEFAIESIASLPTPTPSPHPPSPTINWPRTTHHPPHTNTWLGEIRILSGRSLRTNLRTKQLFAARIIQSTFAGLGLGSVFMSTSSPQSRLGFFAFTLTFLLSSTTEGLPVFLREREVLVREASRGAYRISSYVIASTLVFLPLLLLASLLYSVPVYWMVGLRRDLDGFLFFALITWTVMATASSLVAFVSAAAPDYIMGNTVIAGLLGAFFLFSGYFIEREDMPSYWVFMHYLSLFKYPFEALLVNQYGVGRMECVRRMKAGTRCALDGREFLRQQGLEGSSRWVSLCVMVFFVVGYRALCYLVLRYRLERIACM